MSPARQYPRLNYGYPSRRDQTLFDLDQSVADCRADVRSGVRTSDFYGAGRLIVTYTTKRYCHFLDDTQSKEPD